MNSEIGIPPEVSELLLHVLGTHVRDAFKKGNQSSFRKFLDGYPGSQEVADA